MAYLFSRLNEAIDGAAGGRRASDLLQGGPVQQDRETMGGQQPQGISSQPSAVVGGANPAQPQANASTEAATAVSADARNKVFEKNRAAGNQMTTETTAKLGSGIADAQKNMQAEANKYVSDGAYKLFDQGNVSNALSGDGAAKDNVSNFLNAAQPERKEFAWNDESLQGLRDSTRNLQSQSGLASSLRENAGSDYTRGEANLDASFLQGSEAFRRSRAGLAQRFADLNSLVDKAGADTKAANLAADKAREADRAAVRGTIQREAGNIQQAADQRLEGAKTSQASELAFGRARERAALEAMIQEYRKNIDTRAKDDDAGLSFAREKLAGFERGDMNRFLTENAGALNSNMFLSDSDVGSINTANELLGTGTRVAREEMGQSAVSLQREKVRKELDALLAGDFALNDSSLAAKRQREANNAMGETMVGAARGDTGAAGGTVKRDSLNPLDTVKAVPKKVVASAKETLKPANVLKAPVKAASQAASAAKRLFKK